MGLSSLWRKLSDKKNVDNCNAAVVFVVVIKKLQVFQNKYSSFEMKAHQIWPIYIHSLIESQLLNKFLRWCKNKNILNF